MNRLRQRVALTSAFVMIGILGSTAALGQAVPTSIRDTRHNLGTTTPIGATFDPARNYTSANGTDQICVFCHTPHGADPTQGPLWNRTAGTATYTTYGTTLSGQDSLATVSASASLPCLSCHDGTQALDSVLNAPGSGDTWAVTPTWSRFGTIPETAITNIAGDADSLQNDHPIAIPYRNRTASRNPDMGYEALSGDATTGFWVETGGNTARNKSDMLLFARDFGGTIGTTGSIECATCHDVHGYENSMFLRQPIAGSQLCLSCHIK